MTLSGPRTTSQNNIRKRFADSFSGFPADLRPTVGAILGLESDVLADAQIGFKATRVLVFLARQHRDAHLQQTLLLYRLLSHHVPGENLLSLKSSEKDDHHSPVSDDRIRLLHNKYLQQSDEWVLKDAAVAKAQKGIVYQEHLIILLAYLALRDPAQDPFSIIGEVSVVEAWNDVLFV